MFAIFTTTGSSAAVTQTLCGRSARTMRRLTIACSSRSLSERRSCSPRWSSTAGSALRRVEPASASVPARSPSRRTSSSGLAAMNAPSPRAAQKTWHDGNASRRTPSSAGASCGAGRVDLDLARQHDLVEGPGADALDGAGDRRLVVLGRHRADDLEPPGGIRVEQRERALVQLGRPAPRGARRSRRARRRGGRARRASAGPRRRGAPWRPRARGARPARSPPSAARRRRRTRTRTRRRRPGRCRAGRPGRRRRRARPAPASAAPPPRSGRARARRWPPRSRGRRARTGRGRPARS